MKDEKLVNMMSEARLISAVDNVIYPLIEKKISDRIDMACGKFLSGKTDFIADIAYVTALKSIAEDLNSKQVQGNKALKSIHESEK